MNDDARTERARSAVARLVHDLGTDPRIHGAGVGDGLRYGGEPGPCLVVFVSPEGEAPAVPDRFEGLPVYVERAEPPRQQLVT